MAKISLRAYNREIEGMIEGHQVEEALAHARHVLQSFPKHLETYRLLGKAFLENQRFGEAADIFQRVLSTAPDDFVAHVGMSIIREDEGNLDASIWHMERAFEAQPYNNAIQDELRRLYGRRDGMEPAKVRLTRGALARMYLKGNLYQQAIRELRSALAEDPQRPDLQVLLANTYFQAGQRVEAVEACSMLLKKFPYCFEANRILAAILPDTERSADTEIYRQRLILMDPYFAQLNPRTTSSEGVPDSTIVLDRMEYKMGQAQLPGSSQPTWASNIGVSFQNQDEALPDWLSSDQEQASAVPTSSGSVLPFSDPSGAFDFSSEEKSSAAPTEAAQTDAIPDWMQAVGWNPSSGAFQEGASPVVFDETPEQPAADGPAAPAEIPDWMRGMAPANIDQEPPATDSAAPWLQETQPGASDSVATWLQDLAPQGGTPTQPAAPELETSIEPGELPDWLKDLPAPQTPSQTIAPTSEAADWMQELPTTAGDATRQPSEDLFAQSGEAIPGEIPDWMQDIKPPDASLKDSTPLAGDVPDWMRAATSPSTIPDAAPTTSVTDFLKAIESPQPPAQTPSTADEALDWLKGFEPESGSAAPVLEDQAAASSEGLPDWLKEMPLETPAVEPAAEALPAEGIPDWLTAAAQETPQVVEEESTGVTGFLEALQMPSSPAELTAAEELPEWMRGIEIPAEAAEPVAAELPTIGEPAAVDAAMPDLSNEDAAMAWLEGLAAKQGISEDELLSSPSERAETPPAWVQQEAGATEAAAEAVAESGAVPEAVEAELPDWMKELAPQAAAEAAELPAIEPAAEALPAEGIPDWLTAAAQESPQVVEEESTGVTGFLEALQMPSSPAELTAAEELPEWMRGIEIPAEAAEPVAAELPTIGEPAAPEAAMPDLSNEDAAMAWLEGLAAKQGISEDELLSSPSERVETPPAWVQQEVVEAVPVAQEAAEAEELPEWMRGIEIPAEVAEPAAAELPTIGEPAAPEAAMPDLSNEDAAMAWLEGLAAKQGISEDELLSSPSERVETPPAWVQQEVVEAVPVAQEAAEAEELPAWMREAETPAEVAEPAAAEAALPDLSNEDAAMAWLEGLAAKQGISEDELLSSPSERVETPPAWVQQEVVEAAPIVQEPAAAEELPAWMREAETPAEVAEPAAAEAALPDLSNEDAAMAWLEGLAAKQGISEDELLSSPSERAETPPAWVQQEVVEAAPIVQEPAAAEELPAWMREAETPAEVVEPAAAEAALPDLSNEDAAMAWLEGLAAKQGISEDELLSSPSERVDTPPAWVQQEVVDAAPIVQEPTEAEELPAWMREAETPAEAVEPAAMEAAPTEAPQATASEVAPAPALEEELPAWLSAEEPAAPSEIPAWMQETQITHRDATPQPSEWIAAEQVYAALAEQNAEAERLDVNSASLVQLEALPGIGFILAQNIINHRDSTGKFSRLEDLANVPGIGPATIEEIRSWVKVIPPDKPKSVYRPQPSAGDIAQARLVLSQGNTATASSLYTALLKRGHPVQEIIADLHDALYRHPADVDLWQALGDALMRDGQLQESLNAYTKAEELLQ